MRQIKFRGLKDDMSNCNWVYGNLIYNERNEPMIQTDIKSMLLTTCLKGTESQFTGLTDKHGKEVYEGDIVQKIEEDWEVTDEWTDEDWKEKEIPLKITKIDYVTLERFRFWLKNESFGYEGENLENCEDWEIIGNIHQHAHLLNN